MCVWPRVLSTWFRSKHIFRPAQNRSKDSKPFGGVTFCRLSITPLGRPLVPSSCQRFSISEKAKQIKVDGHYIPHVCHKSHSAVLSDFTHTLYDMLVVFCAVPTINILKSGTLFTLNTMSPQITHYFICALTPQIYNYFNYTILRPRVLRI